MPTERAITTVSNDGRAPVHIESQITPEYDEVATRTLIVQPLSMELLDREIEQVLVQKRQLTDIHFTRSWWPIKGRSSNPREVVAVGGSIEKADHRLLRTMRQNAQNRGEEPPPDTQDVLYQFAAARRALSAVDLQGVQWNEFRKLDIPDRRYIFNQKPTARGEKSKWRAFTEQWFGVRAPMDAEWNIFNPDQDKIQGVVKLDVEQVDKMFSNGRLVYKGKSFPLVGNLIATIRERVDQRVYSHQPEVEKVQAGILDHLGREEREHRLLLVREMIYESTNHPLFGKRKAYPDAENADTQNKWFEAFNAEIDRGKPFDKVYRDFLRFYADTSGVSSSDPDAKHDALINDMRQAWHRVLFKEYSYHAGTIPVQGDFLPARLSWENASFDELTTLEYAGPAAMKNIIQYVKQVVTLPPADIPQKPQYDFFKQAPQTSNEIHQRLKQYRHLKMNEGRLLEDDLLLFKVWQQHFFSEMQRTLGLSPDDFSVSSVLFNTLFSDIQRNIVPRVSNNSTAPSQMGRDRNSVVTQPDELVLMAFGYSQYRDGDRGAGISLRAMYDARLKLSALGPLRDIHRHYHEAVRQSSFYWRRLLDSVCVQKGIPTQVSAGPDMVGLSSTGEYLTPLYTQSEDEQFFISNIIGPDNRVRVYPIEFNGFGIPVYRRETTLVHEGVPLVLFEVTDDKRLMSMIRKAIERGYSPQHIKDVYRTSISLDLETEEMIPILEDAYYRYRQGADGRLSYEQWANEWASAAIRTVLMPALTAKAQEFGYAMKYEQVKNALDSAEPSGGSAASVDVIHDYKGYAVLDFTHVLAEGTDTLSSEAQTMEFVIMRRARDMITKFTTDDEYALRRFENTYPGSGNRTLWNLLYWNKVYPTYKDVAGRSGRLRRQRNFREFETFLQYLGDVLYGTRQGLLYSLSGEESESFFRE